MSEYNGSIIMRPECLQPPFPKEARRTVIHDRVWYAPNPHVGEQHFTFPGWDHPDLFGNSHPVHVEYCSGNGAWIAAKAVAHPGINWVAVEKKFMRVRKIWSKIKNHQLSNLIVICGEGFQATEKYFPSDSVKAIYVNFPDPWPKKRHFKHRLIQPNFVQEMGRILTSKGHLMFVTDDAPYSEWTIDVFQHSSFSSLYPDPYFVTDMPDYGNSYFETLWRQDNRVIRYHQFEAIKK